MRKFKINGATDFDLLDATLNKRIEVIHPDGEAAAGLVDNVRNISQDYQRDENGEVNPVNGRWLHFDWGFAWFVYADCIVIIDD